MRRTLIPAAALWLVAGAAACFAPGSPTTSHLRWVDENGLTDNGRALVEAMEGVGAHGLSPDTFLTAAVRQAVDEAPESPEAAARAEAALSEAFVKLADALGRGLTDPARFGLAWDITRDSLDHGRLLEAVAAGAAPDSLLESLVPTLPWYGSLKRALPEYREIVAAGGWPTVPPGDLLEPGDTSPRVRAVRARLEAEPDPEIRRLAGAQEGNLFDPRLAGAVARFQKRHGIAVDSAVGEGTLAALNVSAADRVASMELNLDRMRRLPRNLGERAILVNVAGFELVVLERGRPALEMGVVVGRPEWRTAIFADSMEFLVVNPYWHVPESIEAEEILPAMREDPGYLNEQGFDLVPEGDNFGEPVSPDDVDWSKADTASLPYDFRQKPGPSNALGLVKFMFPNDHNIYLHDTPADHLFAQHFRAFSHGCIRVERPAELARYILEHASDTPASEFDRLLETGERTQVELAERIPVYIAYFTAWAEDDGLVHFYPDVYDRDAALRADGQ